MLSLHPCDELIPSSQDQRQHDPHTAEMTKALERGSLFRKTTFHSFSPGGAPAPLCSEAALSTHHRFGFPDPAGLSTDKQFCFSQPSASRRVNLELHAAAPSATLPTADSSGSQPMQLCATFSAHLEIPFYSPVVQGRRTVCIYTVCRFTSTFFILGALQHV